jgi:tRNA G18 (ribose-2'-O)-methylase SpoU
MAAAVESVVVVHNVAKRHNVGTLARSATAFGVAEVVVVGRRDVSAFGSHGTSVSATPRRSPWPARTSR